MGIIVMDEIDFFFCKFVKDTDIFLQYYLEIRLKYCDIGLLMILPKYYKYTIKIVGT